MTPVHIRLRFAYAGREWRSGAGEAEESRDGFVPKRGTYSRGALPLVNLELVTMGLQSLLEDATRDPFLLRKERI